MKIAVYGSALGKTSDGAKQRAREVGREIATRGHALITGGCPGIPYEVVLGAKEKKGKTIAFSPALDIEGHKATNFPVEGFDEFVFVPRDFEFRDNPLACRKYRNVTSTASCDAGIIISGAIGTLNEFTCLYDYGKNIGILIGTGGAADMIKKIVETFSKPTKSKIVYDSDPAKLIRKLERLAE